MRIVHDYPPLFDEIDAVFGVRGKPVIFAWGDIIYDPGHGDIRPELIAHEAVHGQRQGSDVVGWWRRYIEDPVFRLAEEVPAHRAEYEHLIESGNRQMRRKALRHVAKRLAAPLYGRLITPVEAKRILAEAA